MTMCPSSFKAFPSSKLVKAHSIMAPIDVLRATEDRSLGDTLRADEGADLSGFTIRLADVLDGPVA
ncbi:hypothetical protein DQW77_11445 [Roseovarius sp. TE539]|uniref:hypothetical protein n=1 Tax=Roseovarius sp. TE539 TaxID=2249812 RepID=UPI000DDC91E3|nr:hypothetical protein [Roseovarius sp. TE539]RBI71937.1 hypothetical protein DQW77_11445 [Roseovarius sp. TE539]